MQATKHLPAYRNRANNRPKSTVASGHPLSSLRAHTCLPVSHANPLSDNKLVVCQRWKAASLRGSAPTNTHTCNHTRIHTCTRAFVRRDIVVAHVETIFITRGWKQFIIPWPMVISAAERRHDSHVCPRFRRRHFGRVVLKVRKRERAREKWGRRE